MIEKEGKELGIGISTNQNIPKPLRRLLHRSKLRAEDRDLSAAHPRHPHPSPGGTISPGIVSERRIWTARDTETRGRGGRLEEEMEEGRLNYEDKRRSGIA